jgi:hypothetical protein
MWRQKTPHQRLNSIELYAFGAGFFYGLIFVRRKIDK